MLEENQKAPDIKLPSSDGKEFNLKDYQGKKNVVLYFYPKDDTPGCTVEACGFSDEIKKIEQLDSIVVGVSPDGIKSHEKFISKFKLPFLLLSDESKKTCQEYGVWVEKSMYGRKYMGVARETFIIGKDGKIKKIFKKVKSQDHNLEVIEFLKTL